MFGVVRFSCGEFVVATGPWEGVEGWEEKLAAGEAVEFAPPTPEQMADIKKAMN